MTNDERKEVLQLVADGKMTIEEALQLFEKSSPKDNATQDVTPLLNKQNPFEEEPKAEQQKKTSSFEDIFGKAFTNKETNKRIDDFMSEVRGDLSQLSNRMMSLFSSTFSKMREFDLDFPFGDKVELDRNFAYNVDEVKGFDISIPNGKITVSKTEEPLVSAKIHVKIMKANGEQEDVAEKFVEQLVRFVQGKLIIATDAKLAHVAVDLQLPDKEYDIFFAKMISGSIEISAVDFKILKLKTYNGAIRAQSIKFDHANFNTGNGSIEVRNVQGDDLEAESINGRIYIDGNIKEIDAQSVNGHVVVTTSNVKPHKLKAHTIAGAVEIYVPKHVSIDGKASTNFGKTDVGLQDVKIVNEEEQLLLKTVHFDKIIEGAPLLKVSAESRTGTVLIRYTITK